MKRLKGLNRREEMMHKIKKYANRKLYNTTEKKYISLDQLAVLIKAGEEVSIVDNRTGEDITSSIVSQLLARDKKDEEAEVPSSILIQLLRRGGGTVVDYAKKYATVFQSAMTMAEDEIDKLVSLMVKDKELSESEGSRLKKEISNYGENLRKWIIDSIDQRIKEVLNIMNLATKEQIIELTAKIDTLKKQVTKLEKGEHKKP
jgi:polyhydroxyalkanoate synthesis repressor PhaR